MNLHEQQAYCAENSRYLESIRTTTNGLLEEDPTTIVITREPGQFVRFVSGQETPQSLLLMDSGAEDIADDPQALGETAQGLNEHFMEVAIRESYEARELITAVSAGIRRLRNETVAQDNTGIPAEYAFEKMTYRQTHARAGDSSALVGSIAFTGLEHEGQAEYWRIVNDVGPETASFQMVCLRDEPVMTRWQFNTPGPTELIERLFELDLPRRLKNVMFDTYNEREDIDVFLQDVYFDYVGSPKENAVSRYLNDLREYVIQKRQRINSELDNTQAPTPNELRSMAIQLNVLRNA